MNTHIKTASRNGLALLGFVTLALSLTFVTSAAAHEGVELGPNKGRILEFSKNETLHGEVTLHQGQFRIAVLDKDMKQKPTQAPIQNEAKNGLKNAAGTIAMARTQAPHSATAQFFINVADNDFLDYPGQDGWGYCVFGKVTDGMDVVNAIKGVKTGSKGFHQDVPVEDVVIQKAEVV